MDHQEIYNYVMDLGGPQKYGAMAATAKHFGVSRTLVSNIVKAGAAGNAAEPAPRELFDASLPGAKITSEKLNDFKAACAAEGISAAEGMRQAVDLFIANVAAGIFRQQ